MEPVCRWSRGTESSVDLALVYECSVDILSNTVAQSELCTVLLFSFVYVDFFHFKKKNSGWYSTFS